MTGLSVILISRNQQWNIARLIESVLEGTSHLASREIVLVDSASTDGTAESASVFPVGVLRLRPDQPLTPAAGRAVGCRHTTGDLVLFLDGDMQLCAGWLERALRVLEERPEVAVATGRVVDLPRSAGSEEMPSFDRDDLEGAIDVLHGGGAALYRRSVLEEVGGFNPYLCSDEEPDLCLRIRAAGYRVLQLRHPIAYHYSDPSHAISTLVARWRRNLYLGAGQAIRYRLGSESLWPYIRERGFGLLPGLGLVAGLGGFAWSLATGEWIWFGSWALLLAATITVDACRKRSLYRTLYSLLHRLLIFDGTVRGFLARPLDPAGYPARLEVIKALPAPKWAVPEVGHGFIPGRPAVSTDWAAGRDATLASVTSPLPYPGLAERRTTKGGESWTSTSLRR